MGRVLNRELVSVIAAVSLGFLAMSIVMPLLPLFLTSIGVSEAMVGLMFSLGMVGVAVGESFGGWLADKIGVRIPLGIGIVLSIPLIMLFAFTVNVPFIFTLFLLWGLVRAAIFAPGRGYIGSTVPVTHKATYIAIYSACGALSRSLGSFIGGYVGEHFGYDWMFYTAAIVLAAGGIIIVFGLSKIPWKKPSLPRTIPGSGAIAGKSPYRSKPFLTQCSAAVLCWIGVGVIGPYIPLIAVERAGITETEVGLLFTITALISAALQIPAGRLADRRNRKTIMITGLLISAAGMAGIAFAGSYILLIGAMTLQTIGTTLFGPGAVALLSDTVPQNWQNTAMGIYGAFEDTGVIIGGALGGVIWEALGAQSAFLLIGTAPSVLAAITVFALLRGKPAAVK